MPSVNRPAVRGACLIAAIASAACSRGGGTAPGHPSPAPAPAARAVPCLLYT
jgi:hypothetical protein